MDTALKYRLTGAVILVLLAVLLLPELLTGSGGLKRPTVVTNGDPAATERRVDIDLTEAARASSTPLPDDSATPAKSAEPVALPVPPSTTPKLEAPPPPPPPTPTPTPTPAPTPATASAGAYFVQIGVFVNRASAESLERKLRERKFTVVVEPIERQGKTLYRVRVGPEPDRAAASTLMKRLAEAGHKGSVVK